MEEIIDLLIGAEKHLSDTDILLKKLNQYGSLDKFDNRISEIQKRYDLLDKKVKEKQQSLLGVLIDLTLLAKRNTFVLRSNEYPVTINGGWSIQIGTVNEMHWSGNLKGLVERLSFVDFEGLCKDMFNHISENFNLAIEDLKKSTETTDTFIQKVLKLSEQIKES